MNFFYGFKKNLVFFAILFLYPAQTIFATGGWASMNGGTTGGAGGETVIVSTGAEFESAVESTSPYIVLVSGNISLRSIGGKVSVKSNKTIRGIDANSTIFGNIAFSSGASNVIIERLNIHNHAGFGEKDGITIKRATNILITNCDIYDSFDGCLDITRESDYITVSWCKFYYTYISEHHFVNLVGGDDGHTGDMGKLHITFHHNWWGERCQERMPSVRYGRVHIYNNYYCPGIINDYCVAARLYSECLIENNYFDNVYYPYFIWWESDQYKDHPGKIGASGNIFESCRGYADPGVDEVFDPPYSYTLDNARDVPILVMAGAGVSGTGPPKRRTNPTNSACGIDLNAVLSWQSEPNAESYDLYLGTSFDDVNDANIHSAEYMGRYETNSYCPGELEEDTTYYWRIDDVNLSDPCSPYKGDVWNFTTVNIYYVDAQATGNDDGSSWDDAFNHLQDALSVASSCEEIRVAEGIYKPDEDTNHPGGSGQREATFELKTGLAVYGGFPSGGGPWHERDPNEYETILSGDLNGDDGPGFENNAENSYHVVTGSETSQTTVLDGFTITSGNANGSSYPHNRDRGGGLFNYGGSPTVANCTFGGNSAYYRGGAMYNDQSNPPVTNCTFSGNSAHYYGGGMYNVQSNQPLTNCTFSSNSARYGGGMHNDWISSPTLTDCTFSENSAESYGGGMRNRDYSSPTLNNCTFSENSANYHGGGMYNIYESSPTLNNCTFSGNPVNRYGGGMYNYYECSPMVTNCTFSSNSANHYGGGMYNYNQSSPTLTNCIFSGNRASSGAGIYCYHNSKSTTFSNCTISGNKVGDFAGGDLISYYSVTIPADLRDISSTGTAVSLYDDHVSGAIPLPFNFEFYGTDFTMIYISSNGFITFLSGQSDGCCNGQLLPSSGSPNGLVAGFWEDLNPTQGGTIRYQTLGTAGSREFIVGFYQVPHFYDTQSVTFEIILHEGTNKIELQYGWAPSDGGNHSIGIENLDGTDGLQVAYGNVSFNYEGFLISRQTQSFGGGIYSRDSNSTMTNCILWENAAPEEPQIYNEGTSSTIVTYSDIQGGWLGEGNIDTDPCFRQPGYWDPNGTPTDANDDFWVEGNYHLLPDSPCINAGDPNYADPNETDLDGLPRVIGGRIDMGAYEYPNTQPVAIAGPNQTVYAWINGLADVNLDGSASYDNDGDTLEYYWHWTIDGNICEANGMNPTISLPVGIHEIELMVHDGIVFSEPNSCFVNVIGPIESSLRIIPPIIRSGRGGIILAMLAMPPGTEPTDIAEEPLKLYPGAIAADRQFIRRIRHNTAILCLFDKSAVLSELNGSDPTINVVGNFTSGQYFYGTDDIHIANK